MTATAAKATPANQIKVKAFSEEHARRISSGLMGKGMDMISQVQVLRQPRAAKTCSTDDFPVRGTRKWKTVYNVYAYGNKIPIGRDKYEYINMEFVTGGFEQKTEAVKVAREMAIKHHLPMTVKLEKELEDGSPHVSDLQPKATEGEYMVTFRV